MPHYTPKSDREKMNPRTSGGFGASAIVSLLLIWIVYWVFGSFVAPLPKPPAETPVTHITMLKFRPDVTPKQMKKTTHYFFNLRENCTLPNKTAPYIRSIWGGRENLTTTTTSPTGATSGATHLFVVDFNSAKERAYFYNEDPCYKRFQNYTTNIIEQTAMLEFTNGIWDPKEKPMPRGFEHRGENEI